MSLRIVVEVALHFESFRNVDLFHQGLYHLKTRLYWEEDGQQLLATPHGYFRNPVQGDVLKGKGNRPDHHHLIPAHIIEDQRTFSTRSFLIRYCEEEVELNEIGQFRIELDPNARDKHGPLTLEVDLMFADLTQHGGPDRFGEQPKDVGATEFKSVSSQHFHIHGMEKGIHEFCPVVFDEFHFCLANLAVHTIALDCRFRLRPSVQGNHRSKAPPQPRALPGADGLGDAAAELPVREGVFSFAEVLFKRADSSGDQLLEHAEDLYERHVGLLAGSHERQRAWLGTVRTKCLTPPHRQLLGDAVEAPELLLPEDMPLHQSSSSTSCPGGARKSCTRLGARLGSAAGYKEIAALVAYDMNLISCQILQLWNKALHTMSYACREVTTLLRLSWEQQMCRRWGVSIHREIAIDDIGRPKNKCIGDAHTSAAEKLRASLKQAISEAPALALEDLSLFPALDDWPCLFEQRYIPRQGPADASSGVPHVHLIDEAESLPSSPKEYRGVHLFVLVHGFQGNSFDMRLMKNNIALLYPDAVFLCSSANEENTEGDFNEMGIRLAQEVVNYICDWCPGSALGRLSFVAHSIGGLIVRCALPLLQEYSSKMYTLLTFSTPHAGYFLKNITLFHLGLRMLQSWRQSTCLSQLSMTDSSDPEDTFLYRLSKTRGLEFFRHVALVSCPSDQYSPFDSARIEVGGMLEMHSHKDVYVSMVRNIWEAVKPERVIRFDVNFNIAEKNLDTFIGRAAHILFLESQHIMRMIIHNYSFLFR